ncbi:MAG TPA: AAA family ATPase [Candidatus Enterenecus stercoripullorum]|nr:AAA family ATPase [Candidatus Enterenecus stercoripullorum]
MKRLILLGGPMGVGKTTVGRALQNRMPGSVFLDGDWCWDAKPFVVNEETKGMVLENIRFLLGQFLRCCAYETVIFCWVMHRREILDAIVSGLDLTGIQVTSFSLTARPEALRRRLEKDIDAGLRQADVVDRSLSYLRHYDDLDTIKVDTTGLDPEETAGTLKRLLAEK